METLLPGLGITCEDMGAMTSNMSSGLWEKVPRCSEKTLEVRTDCIGRILRRKRQGGPAEARGVIAPVFLFEELCTVAVPGVSSVGRVGRGRTSSGPGTNALTLARRMLFLQRPRRRTPVRGGIARALPWKGTGLS